MTNELDRKLIEALWGDARDSYVSRARKLGVVEGTLRRRMKCLVG